jgi:hypothetical protein
MEEKGQSLITQVWRIFQALPPNNFRHLLFTYTLLADQFQKPSEIEDMKLLGREINVIELALVVGQTTPKAMVASLVKPVFLKAYLRPQT